MEKGKYEEIQKKLEGVNTLGGNTMARKITPDELVESEIARYNKKKTVKLAEKERRILAGRKKRLADLRWLDKRGQVLEAEGWTLETLELKYRDSPEEET